MCFPRTFSPKVWVRLVSKLHTMKEYKNSYITDATTVSVNGNTILLQDLFKGAADYADKAYSKDTFEEEMDSEDLAQDSALKILSTVSYDETKSSPATFGNRVAKNCCINAWNKKQRFGDVFSAHTYCDEEGDEYLRPEIDSFRSDENNPERDLISNENLAAIWKCINTFTGDDRVALLMTINGDKPKQIAEALGCTSDAASVRLHRVRNSIKRTLGGLMREYHVCS